MIRTDRTSSSIYLLLGLILLAGLTLRTWNVRFDDGMGSHPDERSTACFYAASIALPQSWDEFKDPRQAPLNPLWDRNEQRRQISPTATFPSTWALPPARSSMRWPLWPRRCLCPSALSPRCARQQWLRSDSGRAADDGPAGYADDLSALSPGAAALRAVVGVAGCGALRLHGQAVQLSHFFAMDPASTTFTVLAVLGGVFMVQDRSWRGALIAGVGAGLAIASKFSALPILAAPVTAALVVASQTTRA